MKRDSTWPYVALLIFFLSLLTGCVTYKSAGVLSAPSPSGRAITLKQLEANKDQYNIYYAGLAPDVPAAVLCDPKNDGKRIIGKRWVKVADDEDVSQLTAFVKNYVNFTPRLYALTGPHGQIFGYVLSPVPRILTRVIDEHTLYIYDIESPLYRGGGGTVAGPDSFE